MSAVQEIVFQTREQKLDKGSWEAGPWMTEPDYAVWVDEATGLDCMVKRNGFGALCGYVGVPEGHKFFEVDYNDIPYGRGGPQDVHGGLTYARECSGGICHVAQPGRPEHVWWLGFDCAHNGDYSPGMPSGFMGRGYPDGYKNFEFVVREIQKLASLLS
jgi:hypothetical protein